MALHQILEFPELEEAPDGRIGVAWLYAIGKELDRQVANLYLREYQRFQNLLVRYLTLGGGAVRAATLATPLIASSSPFRSGWSSP